MPMKLETFDALVDAFFDKCKEVMKTKGADYTKQSDNKLANFEKAAGRRGMSPLNVIGVYQDKHRDCVDSYIKNGELESSESLEMRFVDEINYDLLMIAQAIAEGYAPAEDWLKAALTTIVTKPADLGKPGEPPVRTLDFESSGQACCNPDGDECCDTEEEDGAEAIREGKQDEPES